jgi:hypothetical protein
MRNKPQNQATLQLTSAALILHRQYQVPLEQMKLYVMRIDDETMDIVPVDDSFVSGVGPFVYQDLLHYQQKKLQRPPKNKKKAPGPQQFQKKSM